MGGAEGGRHGDRRRELIGGWGLSGLLVGDGESHLRRQWCR